MKNIFVLIVFLSLAIAGYSQSSTGGIFLRVNDSTIYRSSASTAALHTAGYHDIVYNNQATTPHYDVYFGPGTNDYYHVNSLGWAPTSAGGGGATAAGATGNVQYKSNGGGLQAEAAFSYDSATNILDVDVLTVDTEAYDATGWNADLSVPTKDAVRDKIETSISIPQVSVSTASGTITLDMQSLNAKSFFGSATFATPKTMAMSNVNDGCACLSSFNFWFEVTNVAAVLTFPADWFSGNANFDGTSWTPPAVGIYEFGGSYNDDANRWSIKISNPEQ